MQVYSSICEHTQRVYETENVSRMWPIQFNRRHIAVTVVVSDCLGFIAGCRCRCCVVFFSSSSQVLHHWFKPPLLFIILSFSHVLFSVLAVFMSEKINELATKHSRLFSRQQIDSNGLFISTVFSMPILLNCMLMIVRFVYFNAKHFQNAIRLYNRCVQTIW